jgi:hypothetical protein
MMKCGAEDAADHRHSGRSDAENLTQLTLPQGQSLELQVDAVPTLFAEGPKICATVLAFTLEQD